MFNHLIRRTPQGVRGLKFVTCTNDHHMYGRTPQGVRGLKWFGSSHALPLPGGRTPQGVRGLKSAITLWRCKKLTVAPRKGCVD